MAGNSKHRAAVTRTERRRAVVQRRRDAHKAELQRAKKAARRRRIKWIVPIVLVVVIATTVVVFAATRPTPPPSTSLQSPVVGGSQPLKVGEGSGSYQVVYRLESYDSKGTKKVSTEQVSIRRPFDGHVLVHEGSPPTDTVQLDLRSNFALDGDYSTASAIHVGQAKPGVPLGDLRLDNAIEDLVSQQLFVPREHRKVLGRECQVYRTGQALETLEVFKPSNNDWADVCIDADGLELEEVGVTSKKLSVHVSATQITPKADLGDDVFKIEGDPVGLDQGGTTLTEVDANKAPVAGFAQFPATPAGYTRKPRYLVTVPQQPNTSTGTTPAPVVTYIDSYVNGNDILVVEQGDAVGAPDVSANPGTDVDLGTLGKGKFIPGVEGNSLLLHASNTWFIRVTGTVTSSELQQLAGQLKLSS